MEEWVKSLKNYTVLSGDPENDFHNILSEDILSSMKKDYQIDVLIKNRKLIEKKYKNLIVDSVSLDEIMLLLVKGERNARID